MKGAVASVNVHTYILTYMLGDSYDNDSDDDYDNVMMIVQIDDDVDYR